MTMLGPSFGGRIIQLDRVDSTSSYAARLLYDTVPREGTAVVTRFQLAGKGQRGTSWESDEGKNLLVSYIAYPEFLLPNDQFLLSQSVSLAVAEAIQELSGIQAFIKWPNDILVNDRKIAGILIENAIRNTTFTHSIIGIGLNVNQTVFKTSSPEATSLKLLTYREFDLNKSLSTLSAYLDKWYLLLRSGGIKKIREEYLRLLYLHNQPAGYESKGGHFSGIIRGVHPDGSLDMETTDGRRLIFRNKEIRLVS